MSSDSCKDGASKSNDDVCEVVDKLEKIKTAEDNNVSICANCGKEGSSDEINNTCNKCQQVMYCNAACKKKHRHKHKKDCEEHVRLATERAAKLYDEKLFKQPPPKEDCPICFIRLPSLSSGSRFYSCCGKTICSGCIHATVYDDQGNEVENEKCAFCRAPEIRSDEEAIERLKKRVEVGDADAIYTLGVLYARGIQGFPQDYTKAIELSHRAGELGCANAYYNIGSAYQNGQGVEVDKKKAQHYYELAAMRGDVHARNSMGYMDYNKGDAERALKHWMIAVEGGINLSLEAIKFLYSKGYAAKDDYSKALRLYQEYLCEIKSDQRDEAAAATEDFRYY